MLKKGNGKIFSECFDSNKLQRLLMFIYTQTYSNMYLHIGLHLRYNCIA